MVLAEQDDEWQDGRSYFRSETMALIDAVIDHEEVGVGPLMAADWTAARVAGCCTTSWDIRPN